VPSGIPLALWTLLGGAAMPKLFIPWNKFFYEVAKQTNPKEWLDSGLFKNRGAMVIPSPKNGSNWLRRDSKF
jgi:hypothetical protein